MNSLIIIPARYKSSRFPGKPLEMLLGKPLIWWSYTQAKKSKATEVVVATDDDRIFSVCQELNINCRMTSAECKTSTERAFEVAKNCKYDCYIVVNGDEPLISPDVINSIIPESIEDFFVSNIVTKIKNPVEALDPSNIKVVRDKSGNAILYTRSLVPFPKSSLDYSMYKHVGVLCYSLSALSFFANTERGFLESIEDINELRFIENNKKIKIIEADCNTLSVDTPKDLQIVSKILEEQKNESR